jgi:hypothetical protein
MSSDALLYPAIFIFSLLIVGLVFTVIEFQKISAEDDKSKQQD